MDIASTLASLPDEAGVYEYFDSSKRLLYVGKAKSLRKRVKSYFAKDLSASKRLSLRIQKMISETAHIEYILTKTQSNALILENSLIKQLKPKYNILLRDDKTYAYIAYNKSDKFKRFEIVRKLSKDKNMVYFGPITSGAKEILQSIYELFALAQKKSCLRGKKACLYYQINRCLAPCEARVSVHDYDKIFNSSLETLKNKKLLISKLEKQMEFLSDKLQFEDAKRIHERLKKIRASAIMSDVDLARLENFDVIALAKQGTFGCFTHLIIRFGKVISSSFKKFNSPLIDENEAYERMIMSIYKDDFSLPKKIYVYEKLKNATIIEQALFDKLHCHTKIICPLRSTKRNLCVLAHENALNATKQDEKIEEKIHEYFGLDFVPRRVECFDNSHINANYCVGAMVVYEQGFDKKSYRHYHLEATNEYAQMQELLTKRAMSFDKNPPPDLWLIDGGKTLLDLARLVLESAGVYIDVIAIAKEKRDGKANRAKTKAKDIVYHKDKIHRLSSSDERLWFLQKLRDESHRFAISFFRKTKQKQDLHIQALNAKGIGEAKLKRLLDFFGSFEAIKQASLKDLSSLIDEKSAKNLKQIL